MRILVTFILILIGSSLNAQIAFHKIYSQGSFDFGYGIDQLEDSSFIVTGSSGGFGSGSQAFLLKLDKFGDYEWSLGYGGMESEEGKRVIYLKDIGYFIGGTTNSFGNGAYDMYLTKVELDGTQSWEYSFGGAAWDRMHDMALTRDSGFLLVGENSSNPNENQNGYVVRTDKDGNVLWEQTFGAGGDDVLRTIRKYNDSSFVIAGSYYNADSTFKKGVMYKIVDDGTILDTIYLGQYGEYGINDVEIMGGHIEAVGYRNNPDSPIKEHYAWEVDLTTHSIVSEWGVPQYGEIECITSYDNDSRRYLTYNYGGPGTFEGGPDAAIGAFNQDIIYLGTAAQISDNGLDQTSDAIRTSDGGAVVVGSTAGPGFGVITVFVTKIGPGEVYPTTSAPIVYDLVELVPIEANKDLNVYPNPFNSILNIDAEQEQLRLSIVSMTGQLLHQEEVYGNSELDLSHLQTGAYLLVIESSKGKFQQRLVKY
ncbi:MAG: T9SS type A sorting domain-containing protein [Crocinitomicaceae bacterium]